MKLCQHHKLGLETNSTSTTLLVEFHHCMDFVNLHCCGGGEKGRFQLLFKRDLETSRSLPLPQGEGWNLCEEHPLAIWSESSRNVTDLTWKGMSVFDKSQETMMRHIYH